MPNTDNGRFDTNEMWDGNGTYWIEVGVYSGEDYYGNYHNKAWFWADRRPNSTPPFHEHFPSGFNRAGTGTSYATEIYYLGNRAWQIVGGNSTADMGQSTSQPVYITSAENAGSEYTASSTSGIRDKGKVHGLEYKTTDNHWHYWGSNGFDVPGAGTGHYITHSYSSTPSTEYWRGPC